jgi:hypothetical protein
MNSKYKIVVGSVPAIALSYAAATAVRGDEVQSVAAQVLAQLAQQPPVPAAQTPVPLPRLRAGAGIRR